MSANPRERAAHAERLRDRVAEGRFLEARDALEEYCGALRKTAAGLPPGDPGLGLLEDEWRGLLEQTRRQVLAGRAHAAARLSRVPKASRPYGEGPPPRSSWECSG